MTLRDTHDELQRAIDAGDVAAAIDRYGDLQDASIDELLDEFTAAVESGDRELAATLADQLATTLDERRREQVQTLERSVTARGQESISESEAQALQEYIQSVTATSLNRNGFLTGTATLLSSFEELSADEREQAADSASSLKESEQQTESSQSSAEEATEQTTVPPTVQLVALSTPEVELATGQTAAVQTEVSNAGDDPARGVAVGVTAPPGLAFNGTRQQLGRVDPDATETATFEFSAVEPGSYDVRFEVDSENAGSGVRETRVEVTEAATTPVAALAGDNRRIEFREVVTAISLYNQNEPVPGAEGSRLTFEDVLRVIALFNTEEPV